MMLSIVAAGVTRSTASQEASRTEVVSAIEARLEAAARNDRTTWSSYVADEGDDGEVLGREGWRLEAGRPHGVIGDVEVRLYGQTAVARYLPPGAARSAQVAKLKRVETFVRRDGRWLLVGIARDQQLEGSATEKDLNERVSVGRPTVLH
jgi:hypothetical protein